jgi:hypothetical protein
MAVTSAREAAFKALKALSDLGGRDPENKEHDEQALRDAALEYARSVQGVARRFSILAEVEWHFEEGDVNWRYCKAQASLGHRYANEFILYIGEAEDGFWVRKMDEMRAFGCTEDFIAAYEAARDDGAMRVLFWV